MTKNLETSPQTFRGKGIEEVILEGEETATNTPEVGEVITSPWKKQEV